MNLIEELEQFIKETKDARELKRAWAVKMILQKKSYHDLKECIGGEHPNFEENQEFNAFCQLSIVNCWFFTINN